MKIRIKRPYNVVRLGRLVLDGIEDWLGEGHIRLASFGSIFHSKIPRIMARTAGWWGVVQTIYVRLLYYRQEGKLGCMGDDGDC